MEGDVIRETSKKEHEPEDEIHPWKQKRLKRAIQSYILENNLEDADWQFDVLGVFIDIKKKIAKVRFTENIYLTYKHDKT